MKSFARLFIAPLALLALPVGGQEAAPADFEPDFETAEKAVKRGEMRPLSAILDELAAIQPGRVIAIELDIEDGLPIYDVELITPDGRLLEVDIDAKTGMILSMDEDD